MTLVLSVAEYRQLHQRKTKQDEANSSLEDFETLYLKPESLSQSGSTSRIELMSGVNLYVWNWYYSQEMILNVPESIRPIQLAILISGSIDFNIYPTLNGRQGYFSGGGISSAFVENYQKSPQDYSLRLPEGYPKGLAARRASRSQHILGINVRVDPQQLIDLFPDLINERGDLVKLLLNLNQPKNSFFPQVTPLMKTIVKQIINAPFRGAIRKIYLQGKVLELLALQLEVISTPVNQTKFKPQTIDCIYHARDILDRTYKNPPSIVELAKQVGISDRTLQRGFRQLFDITVIGYITYLRIQQAEQLLRSGNVSVAEVANLVGYSHLGHFAAAFKRQIGISPSDCLSGKLVSR